MTSGDSWDAYADIHSGDSNVSPTQLANMTVVGLDTTIRTRPLADLFAVTIQVPGVVDRRRAPASRQPFAEPSLTVYVSAPPWGSPVVLSVSQRRTCPERDAIVSAGGFGVEVVGGGAGVVVVVTGAEAGGEAGGEADGGGGATPVPVRTTVWTPLPSFP